MFTANDDATGIELWQSDGTEAGTVQFTDIAAGAASSNPTSFTTDNVTFLYMSANDVVRGRELWGMFIAPRVVYLPIVLPDSSQDLRDCPRSLSEKSAAFVTSEAVKPASF